MNTTIRSKVDRELTSRVGKWFTVRDIQDKLRINPSTLKPLIMKYARERVLVRRKVKGTARSVEFSPAAKSATAFHQVLVRHMPYRNLSAAGTRSKTRSSSKTTASSRRKASSKTKRK